jgi:hypothetical protein
MSRCFLKLGAGMPVPLEGAHGLTIRDLRADWGNSLQRGQSVLRWAFEGKSTRQRAENGEFDATRPGKGDIVDLASARKRLAVIHETPKI